MLTHWIQYIHSLMTFQNIRNIRKDRRPYLHTCPRPVTQSIEATGQQPGKLFLEGQVRYASLHVSLMEGLF